MVYEICHLVHILRLKGTTVTFCWVPSHCGLLFNNWADRAAKAGALRTHASVKLSIPLSIQEAYRHLEKTVWFQLKQKNQTFSHPADIKWCKNFSLLMNRSNIKHCRAITTLIFKIKLNAFKTKFSKNVTCLCGNRISTQHILFDCKILQNRLPHIRALSMKDICSNQTLLITVANCLLLSPVYALL